MPKFAKAVFNFFVGDWYILGGVVISLIVLALLVNLASLQNVAGFVFILGVLITLAVCLRREITPHSKK